MRTVFLLFWIQSFLFLCLLGGWRSPLLEMRENPPYHCHRHYQRAWAVRAVDSSCFSRPIFYFGFYVLAPTVNTEKILAPLYPIEVRDFLKADEAILALLRKLKLLMRKRSSTWITTNACLIFEVLLSPLLKPEFVEFLVLPVQVREHSKGLVKAKAEDLAHFWGELLLAFGDSLHIHCFVRLLTEERRLLGFSLGERRIVLVVNLFFLGIPALVVVDIIHPYFLN